MVGRWVVFTPWEAFGVSRVSVADLILRSMLIRVPQPRWFLVFQPLARLTLETSGVNASTHQNMCGIRLCISTLR